MDELGSEGNCGKEALGMESDGLKEQECGEVGKILSEPVQKFVRAAAIK